MDWDDSSICASCGSRELSPGEDGFYYCNVCSSQSQNFQEEVFDEEQRANFHRGYVREYNVARNESLAAQVQNQLQDIFGTGLEDAPFATFLDDCGPGTVFGLQYPNFAHQVACQLSKHLGSKFASYYLAAQIAARSESQPAVSGSQPELGSYLAASQVGSQVAALAAPELRAQVEEILFEKFSNTLRKTYLHGLQRILQMQCEVLIERFGVTPLICGICGALWPRFLASTNVFDRDWAKLALETAEAAEKSRHHNQRRLKKVASETKGEEVNNIEKDGHTISKNKKRKKAPIPRGFDVPRTSFNVKATDVWLRSLKARVPVRTTLAILYLACYVARETVLPTDITDWAFQGLLPYLAACRELLKPMTRNGVVIAEVTNYPIDVKIMFQPDNVTGARNLEYLAGHIAQSIGLQIPPVNFHGILSRFLVELGLPMDHLLKYGSRLHQWYTPAGLWLSAKEEALPTRVYVMAMLIVILKIFYKLDGRASLDKEACLEDVAVLESRNDICTKEAEVQGLEKNTKHGDIKDSSSNHVEKSKVFSLEGQRSRAAANSRLRKMENQKTRMEQRNSEHEWPAKEMLDNLRPLLQNAESFEFEKDLASYMKYCRDVIFPPTDLRHDEEKSRKQFLRIFSKPVGESTPGGDLGDRPNAAGNSRSKLQVDTEVSDSLGTFQSVESRVVAHIEKAAREETYQFMVPASQGAMGQDIVSEMEAQYQDQELFEGEGAELKGIVSNLGEVTEQMESVGFECISPLVRVPCSDGYVRYNFVKSKTGHYSVHRDYFIVLQVCSKILKVHPKALHKAVQDVERGLLQTELGVEAFVSELQRLERKLDGRLADLEGESGLKQQTGVIRTMVVDEIQGPPPKRRR